MIPRPNAGVHHNADNGVVEMRRREISRKSFAARLRHEKRTKTRNPTVPFVVWKVGEKQEP